MQITCHTVYDVQSTEYRVQTSRPRPQHKELIIQGSKYRENDLALFSAVYAWMDVGCPVHHW